MTRPVPKLLGFLLTALAACFPTAAFGAPAISISASPSTIPPGTSTSVTATVQISGGTALPGSVNLLQVDASGAAQSVLGAMTDAGNGTFTLAVPFSPTQEGQIYLQASADVQGILLRAKSPVSTIEVSEGACPAPWSTATKVYATLSIKASGTHSETYKSANVEVVTETISRSTISRVTLIGNGGCYWEWDGTGIFAYGSLLDRVTDMDPPVTSCTTSTANGPAQEYSSLPFELAIQSNMYKVHFDGMVNGTVGDCGTGGRAPINFLLEWEPQPNVGPLDYWHPLPSSGSLSGDFVFSADASWLNWEVTWNFSPVPDDSPDKPCKDNTGSEVGCQSQTLGENLPITGTPFFLHYASDRALGRAGSDSVAILDALQLGGWTLNVHHALALDVNNCFPNCILGIPKGLFLGDGSTRSASEVQLAPFRADNLGLFTYYLTSEDGSEVYVFDYSGLHLKTLRPLTGAVLYTFGYDANQRLTSVADANANVTTIQRDASGNPTAIVSPYGQTTTLALDGKGYLSQVTDPAGNIVRLVTSDSGLLTSMTDANGNTHSFEYDQMGRLLKDSDPAGGSLSLARTDTASGYSVTKTTALDRTSIYNTTLSSTGSSASQTFVNTWPDGLQATSTSTQQTGALSDNTTLPDGTSGTSTTGPDPRWGIQVPIPANTSTTLGSLTMNTTFARAATLSTPTDLFGLTAQTDTETINGRAYTSVFSAANLTNTNTSPFGRKSTVTLDKQERMAGTQVGGLLPTQFTYDSRGRLATLTQGTRTSAFTYDQNGRVGGVTNPLNFSDTFTNDTAGNVLTHTLADGRTVTYTYDANGNMTSVTPPGKSTHTFSYSKVDLPASYTPPPVTGAAATRYVYNAERQLTGLTRPDGTLVGFSYDEAGRLSSRVTPSGTINYAYSVTTGQLASASVAGGEGLTYSYNGPLLASSAWAGAVVGSVSRTYDNNFWVDSQSVNGGSTIAYTRDSDGLITFAGPLSVTRSTQNTLIAGTTLGAASDSRTYNSYGELTGYTAGAGVPPLYSAQITRDNLGRIASKTETIQGASTAYAYTFDATGRLTGVSRNGNKTSAYTYDSNSNRLTAVTTSGSANAMYDAQDRMLTYGGATYTYTANGELSSKSVGAQITTYQYDAFGNLLAVSLPNGTAIRYIVDAENRRVGKMVNGTLAAGFLYDGSRIVAQLNAAGVMVSQFVYGTGRQTPDYIVQGGVTYRIFSDQVGSPRLLVNTSTGQVAERIDYDEFGNVTNDTNPGFQPFGFAGGLYDQDTKLLRFGARDYDPNTGRWTAKDPILFAGGDTNLYEYASNDPVNKIDSAGHCPLCLAIALGIAVVSEQNDGPGGSVAPLLALPFAGADALLTARLVRPVAAAACGQAAQSGRLQQVLNAISDLYTTFGPQSGSEALEVIERAVSSLNLEPGVLTSTGPYGEMVLQNAGNVLTTIGPDGQIIVSRGTDVLLWLAP
jgi:RHS repeat-associated protein